MAIAFDAATDGGNNAGVGNHTFAHTCGGSDRVLLVGFWGNNFGNIDYVTGVTYNGVAMTAVTGTLVNASMLRYLHLYLLVGPASGTHNVVVSISSNQYVIAVAASYTGCLQSAQPDAVTTAVGGTGGATTTLTTIADNCWLALVSSSYPGTAAGTAPATERTHDAAATSTYIFDSNGPITPVGSTSLTTTRSGSSSGTGQIMVSLAPAGAAAGETSVARAAFF